MYSFEESYKFLLEEVEKLVAIGYKRENLIIRLSNTFYQLCVQRKKILSYNPAIAPEFISKVLFTVQSACNFTWLIQSTIDNHFVAFNGFKEIPRELCKNMWEEF